MEALGLETGIKILTQFGTSGLVLLLWYLSNRANQETLKQYREDMLEQRRHYENNVELVKQYLGLASDQREVVVLNIQAMTKLVESINTNQFCPMIRLQKVAQGRVDNE